MTDTVSEIEISFEVWQDGDMVAAADNLSDAQHFMLVYAQDGPAEAKTAITTRFRGFAAPVEALSSKPVDDTGEANSSVKPPVDAVAWRWRETGTDDPWDYRDDREPKRMDCTVQPLYPHPPQPVALPGDLRERVARRICRIVRTWQGFKATPEYTLDMEVENAWDDWLSEADAILDLIQSERGSPIGQNDQPGLAFSGELRAAAPMTAQELAEHAQFAFENDLPDDFTPYDCAMAWRRVGEHLAAVLAERADG